MLRGGSLKKPEVPGHTRQRTGEEKSREGELVYKDGIKSVKGVRGTQWYSELREEWTL